MDIQKIDMYLVANRNFFPADQIVMLREKLLAVPDTQVEKAMLTTTLKDPTTSLVVSILLGSLGMDRLMIGDVGWGLLKLFTFGGFGIWTVIDWFFIQELTRKKNLDSMLSVLPLLS